MARILYGVCGVGAGHCVRSRILISHLIKKGHKLLIIGSLHAYDYLRRYFDNVHYVDGPEFAIKGNKILAIHTLFKNFKKLNKKNREINSKLKYEIDKFSPDIIISDFEPYTFSYAKKNNIKLISFDNEHYLSEGIIDIPLKYKIHYLISRIYMSGYKADYLLIFTLPGQELKKHSKARKVNPVIRDSLLNIKSKNGRYILVYTSIINEKNKLEVLTKINEKFVIFGNYKDKEKKNLTFRSFNEKEFERALAGCKAVITFGGINLISEAIYMKKPLLVVPIKNHIEQVVNASYVKDNNYGEFYDELREDNIKDFLNKLGYYKTKKFNPGNNELFKMINFIIKGEK